jgi:hypothetical protein
MATEDIRAAARARKTLAKSIRRLYRPRLAPFLFDVIDPYPRLIELLIQATQDLFALHDLPVHASTTRGVPPKGRQVLGTIGFGGPDMKGALAVLADESFWRSLAPPDAPTEDHLLVDMVGEFANMLLGRVRNAVLPLGADVATAIPAAFCGTDLALHRTIVAKPDWHVFGTDRGPLFVRLQVAFRKGFRFAEDTEWAVHPNEADLVLF